MSSYNETNMYLFARLYAASAFAASRAAPQERDQPRSALSGGGRRLPGNGDDRRSCGNFTRKYSLMVRMKTFIYNDACERRIYFQQLRLPVIRGAAIAPKAPSRGLRFQLATDRHFRILERHHFRYIARTSFHRHLRSPYKHTPCQLNRAVNLGRFRSTFSR